MNRITTVSTKGQLVIPAEMRESLGIHPGTRIAISLNGARIVLEPVSEKLVDDTGGMLRGGPSLGAALRQEREKERRRERW